MTNANKADIPDKSGSYWAFVPAGLLVTMLAGLGTLAAIATDDPSFAVETDYYKKAVAWDQELEQQAQNARLGRQLKLETVPLGGGVTRLVVRVDDSNGKPVSGASVRLEAFPNARAGERQQLSLGERANGSYADQVRVTRAGLWELRFTVTSGRDRTTHVVRVDMAPKANGA